MKSSIRRRLSVAVLLAYIAPTISIPLLACEMPLTSASIREAAALGRRKDVKTALFLKRYTQEFPAPKAGPHIAVIRLQTPYVQVVERAGESPNYDAQDAEKEFLGKPGILRFTVRIDFTRSYSHRLPARDPSTAQERPPDFWRDFQIRVLHGSAELPPAKLAGTPLYSGDTTEGQAPLDGAIVTLEFEAGKFQCVPTTVDVMTPDGQHIEAPFDLMKLR
jgi:hypothetical protein